jgi:hypothetical protein
MPIQPDAPLSKPRHTLNTAGKVTIAALLLACLNPVTLFTVLPSLSFPALTSMDLALEQLDYTLKMMPRLFKNR